jgi:hypothetical protein
LGTCPKVKYKIKDIDNKGRGFFILLLGPYLIKIKNVKTGRVISENLEVHLIKKAIIYW